MNHNARSGVTIHTVSEDRAGQRLDNLLMALLKGVPRTWVYRVIRKGQVRVNGSRCKPTTRLQAGDQVRIPPVRTSQKGTAEVPPKAVATVLERILHDDPDYLVIDKPAGMAVHAGSGLAWGVIDAVRQSGSFGAVELVHRLDRETSGCLLLAKSRDALQRAQQAFTQGRVGKRYLCLARGRLAEDRIQVDAPLARNVLRGGERMVQVDEAQGKPARSEFRRIDCGPDWSFAEVSIETGRTHQIRVHACHLGHPLAGDEKYGDRHWNRELRDLGLRRLFLHCAHLEVDDLVAHAPLAEDLANVLDSLQEKNR